MTRVRKKFTEVEQTEIVEETPQKVDDALVLKVDHTHAGVKYAAGTVIDLMNPSESTLGFLKEHGIV